MKDKWYKGENYIKFTDTFFVDHHLNDETFVLWTKQMISKPPKLLK